MRLFTGIPIPLDIREDIAAFIADAPVPMEGVKWVEKNNFHITLKFFGEVGGDIVPSIIKGLLESAAGKEPFLVSLSSVGAFPSLKYPRVYWIGVEKGNEMVKILHDDIQREMQRLGFAAEGRRFHPHCTIGRVRKFAKGIQFAPGKSSFGEFVAENFCLYKSTILKNGPIYDIIETIEL